MEIMIVLLHIGNLMKHMEILLMTPQVTILTEMLMGGHYGFKECEEMRYILME